MSAVSVFRGSSIRSRLTCHDRSTTPTISPSVAFGPFRLDRASETLTRNGGPVRLRPKAFAMLAHLVAASGRLVTKQELMDDLWPGVFVDEGALKTCIRELREALGDNARQPQYIETAHRRGYRFIAPVNMCRLPPATVGHGWFASPRTCYARHGDSNIAYHVLGDGALDIVFATGWVSQIEELWAEPSFASFLLRLATFARVVLFDTRGAGLADRFGDTLTVDRRVEEILAVMDAAGSQRAALLGVSDGGPMCTLFATRYPARTAALILCAAAPLTRITGDVDVRDVLSTLTCPTAILHRRGDRTTPVEAARYMADRLPSARLVELPGDDHLPFVGDSDEVVDQIEQFLIARGDVGHRASVLASA